jgi:hypothetical protein
MINDAYTPPPVDVQPAEIQTIDANQQQQFSSPEQSAISDINSGKYGEGFTAGMPESSQNNTLQNARDLNESVEGIGQGAASLAEASKKGEEISNLDNALQGPGYADHCDPPAQNEGIESFRAAIDEKESITSATDASKSNNEGIASFREASSGQSVDNASSSEQSSGQSADSGGQSSDSGGQSSDSGGQSM